VDRPDFSARQTIHEVTRSETKWQITLQPLYPIRHSIMELP
jgi:hypothetical protein